MSMCAVPVQSIEQQMRQQNAAVAAVVSGTMAAASPRALPLDHYAYGSAQQQQPPAAVPVPLPVRAMSHQEIRSQLRKFKEEQEMMAAQKVAALSSGGDNSTQHRPQPEPEPEPEPEPGTT